MDSRETLMLRWSTAALVMAGYAALAAVPQIGPALLFPPLVALACSRGAEYLDRHYPAYRVFTRGLTVTYLCFIPLTVLAFGVLNAVVLLVCYIQFYTLLHRKEARNYYHLHLMALFLLLAACVQSPDPIIGLVLFLFVVSAVWASLALRLVAEEADAASCTTPEIVGLDQLDHHAFQRKDERSRGKMPLTAGALSIATVLMTALFFMFTPRIEAGLFGRSQQVVERTGISDSVDLSGGLSIAQDPTPVMMVRFPDEPDGRIPDENWLYWRVTTLNRYVGDSWESQTGEIFDPGIAHRGPFVVEPHAGPDVQRGMLARTRRPDKRLVRQEIYADTIPPNGIPALHLVQSIWIADNGRGKRLRWGRHGDLTVVLDKADNIRRLDYEVLSEPGQPSPETLRAAPDFSYDPSDSRAANFLRHDLAAETVALANEITAGSGNAYDKAMAIERYLSGSEFLYSTNVPDMGRGSVIDRFINQVKMGHCELFATAMALMLRTQGVPTRVVSGYRGGEWQESDEIYTIRANMAHLWVEVWFPGTGWVIFDPSPRSDTGGLTTMEQLALMISRAGLKAKMFWFQEVVGFDRAAQLNRFREFSLGFVRGLTGDAEDGGAVEATAAMREARGGKYLAPLLLLGVAAGCIWLIARRRRPPVVRDVALTPEQVQVVKLYLRLRRKLTRFGVDCRGKTAEELGEELATERWGAPEGVMELLSCYNTVRFGGYPLPPARLAALRSAVKALQPRDVGRRGPVRDAAVSTG